MAEWDPDDAIANLAMESSLDLNPQEGARRIFRENAIVAAQSIAHIAVYGSTEKLRLDAAKYVVDRNLGKLTDAPDNSDQENDPFQKLLADCVKEAGPTQ